MKLKEKHHTRHHLTVGTALTGGKTIQSQPIKYTIKFMTLKKISHKTLFRP